MSKNILFMNATYCRYLLITAFPFYTSCLDIVNSDPPSDLRVNGTNGPAKRIIETEFKISPIVGFYEPKMVNEYIGDYNRSGFLTQFTQCNSDSVIEHKTIYIYDMPYQTIKKITSGLGDSIENIQQYYYEKNSKLPYKSENINSIGKKITEESYSYDFEDNLIMLKTHYFDMPELDSKTTYKYGKNRNMIFSDETTKVYIESTLNKYNDNNELISTCSYENGHQYSCRSEKIIEADKYKNWIKAYLYVNDTLQYYRIRKIEYYN